MTAGRRRGGGREEEEEEVDKGGGRRNRREEEQMTDEGKEEKRGGASRIKQAERGWRRMKMTKRQGRRSRFLDHGWTCACVRVCVMKQSIKIRRFHTGRWQDGVAGAGEEVTPG